MRLYGRGNHAGMPCAECGKPVEVPYWDGYEHGLWCGKCGLQRLYDELAGRKQAAITANSCVEGDK